MSTQPVPTWVVTLDGRLPAEQVADLLRSAGMQVNEVLSHVGVIIGQAEPGQIAALRQVPGVGDIVPNAAMGAAGP